MRDIKLLEQTAKQVRSKVLDLSIEYKDGHIASSFSQVEILVALYDGIMGKNDRFILSKGHGCLSFYEMLRRKGFNPKISGHPDIEPDQGIVCTTGSLGHGLPIGVGMAFAKKVQGKPGHVYSLVGDGECQEGTTWESLNLARKFKLDNLTVIVDHNKLQALAKIEDIMDETNLRAKFESFGCNVLEVAGHDFTALLENLGADMIKKDIPRTVIAYTIKGKGLSFMENNPIWHSRMIDSELLEQAYKELK